MIQLSYLFHEICIFFKMLFISDTLSFISYSDLLNFQGITKDVRIQ